MSGFSEFIGAVSGIWLILLTLGMSGIFIFCLGYTIVGMFGGCHNFTSRINKIIGDV